MAQRPWIVLIPGTTKAHRLAENLASAEVTLEVEDLARIQEAAARIKIKGDRYNEAGLRSVGL